MKPRAESLPPPSVHATARHRIAAMVLRYWYLYRGSWPRLIETIYWPLVQMTMWGFLQTFLAGQSSFFAQAGGILIGSVMLWDILFRGQLGFSMSFLEEMWSRNLGHLLVSPLRPSEFVASLVIMSICRVAIGLIPTSILAIAFFGFNLYGLGIALVAFFANLLLTSWAIGMFVSGFVLRHGLGAEGLVWSVVFLLLPLTCVYYPASTLPEWLQIISFSLAPTYVFEGMRSLLIDGVYRADLMWTALLLNIGYFSAGALAFAWFYRDARRRGVLLQIGE